MRGFTAFLRKELVEIARTWRIWVLPGMVLFFALSGPVLAKLTPQLIASMSTPGLTITMPDPTWHDAYAQWAKNLGQIVAIAVVVIFGGLISSEKRAGTAALVLTKPVSRAGFVVAKVVSQGILLVGTVCAGAAITWGVTLGVFGMAPPGDLVRATAAWLAFGLMLLGVMTLLSTLLSSQAGAAGLGLVVFLVLSVLTAWGPTLRRSPAGLVVAPAEIVAGKDPALLWPVATALLLGAACVALAVAVFRRQEL